MNAATKHFVGWAARVPVLSRGLLALTKPGRFLVLCYHRVCNEPNPFFEGTPVAKFREQMTLLREHFDVRPLGELVSGDVPENAAAVTFDDGYRDNYTNAFPILRDLGLPATIFLVTDALDENRMIWHDKIFDAFHRTKVELVDPERLLAELLKEVRSVGPDERESRIERLLEELAVEPDGNGWEKLTWDQVREMSDGGIEFGAHTLDHPILSRVSSEEARRQIRGSKERIESELGCEVTSFAYPNGRSMDFDESTKRILGEEGFRLAVTTVSGANDASTDPLELRRVDMWGDDPHLSLVRLALSRARD